MRRIVTFVLTITFSLGLADWGIAGPFGLTMGMRPSDFKGLEERSERGTYIIQEVPKPHSAFGNYILAFGSETGLCKVSAVGRVVATSVYGTELRSAFDDLEKRLQAQYGKNERFDFLKTGSIWNEPNDFMRSLLKKERTLVATWPAEKGSMLGDGLKGIVMQAFALSEESALVKVSYDFQNIAECIKELHAAEDDAL